MTADHGNKDKVSSSPDHRTDGSGPNQPKSAPAPHARRLAAIRGFDAL